MSPESVRHSRKEQGGPGLRPVPPKATCKTRLEQATGRDPQPTEHWLPAGGGTAPKQKEQGPEAKEQELKRFTDRKSVV